MNSSLNLQHSGNNTNNFVLERKLISIHSEDRDITKWPYANTFEIQLPDAYQNIHSMRLVDITIPVNYYTFSNDNQNTKMCFSVVPKDASGVFYTNLNDSSNVSFQIQIQEGFYEPYELANEITTKMNKKITSNHHEKGGAPSETYDKFSVFYDNVAQKYWFGNTEDDFTLNFAEEIVYDLSNTQQPIVWEQYTKWGLPSYIGFDKQTYTTSSDASGVEFGYLLLSDTYWIKPASSGQSVYYTKAPRTLNINGEKTIYMEIDKYCTYDELVPYSEATTATATCIRNKQVYKSDYGGRKNSAFAKIPVTTLPHGDTFESRNGFLQNVAIFDPPLERIQKLKFKFRYHDGRLVDFNHNPLNFTLELHKLKNEIQQTNTIRVPPLYTL